MNSFDVLLSVHFLVKCQIIVTHRRCEMKIPSIINAIRTLQLTTTTTTTTTSLFLTLNIQISHHLQIARLIEAGGV